MRPATPDDRPAAAPLEHVEHGPIVTGRLDAFLQEHRPNAKLGVRSAQPMPRRMCGAIGRGVS